MSLDGLIWSLRKTCILVRPSSLVFPSAIYIYFYYFFNVVFLKKKVEFFFGGFQESLHIMWNYIGLIFRAKVEHLSGMPMKK